MADFNIKNNPVFKNTMRKLETSDRAHANVFNALFETLLDNDNSLKKSLEKSGEDLDEKINSKGGDISETKVGKIKESSAEFPVPEKDDTQETLWGKLKKWQQDCLAKFGNYVLTSMITNQHLNDTNRIPTSALVYLMQQSITQLNRDLADAKSNIQRRYPLDLLYPFSAACQFDSNGECPITLTRPLAHDFLLFLVAGTLDISLKNSTVQSTILVCPDVAGQRIWVSGLIFCAY